MSKVFLRTDFTKEKTFPSRSNKYDNGRNSSAIKKLGITADGTIVVDRPNSHFHPEGGMTPKLLSDAISKIDLSNKPDFIKVVVPFDRTVGYTTCVAVTEDDDIVMVHRIGRGKGLTPMVRNREPVPCSKVTVILSKRGRKATLITAFIGGGSEKEPWDPNIKSDEEKQRCIAFWRTHALIYDEKLIDYIA